ncbi:MAG: ATP-dependent zinc metalloprotease FtsH [Alphaproteobacteria bacterium]
MDPKVKINFWYVVFAVFAILALQFLYVQAQRVEPISYSAFKAALRDGRVAEVLIGDNVIQGTFRESGPEGPKAFVTTRVDQDLVQDLEQYGVDYTGIVESTFLRDLLSWVVPVVLFFGLWMFLFRNIAERQGLGGFMAIGKSKAKIYVEKDTKVTFDDVAGVEEAKDELKEVVAFLRDPRQYGRLGARMPKGVLLVGPPGTGKTLLARAVAGEAGVAFLSISGSEFVEMFVGVGAARVRDLFEQARKAAPCIIFIDELDALGRARGAGPLTGGHDEKEQTLNQLLAELDGFDPSEGVVLLAATNRPEILDPALLRAGRFDRQVLVDKPDLRGRLAILGVHVKKVRIDPALDIKDVASLTPGFTGADLANLVNEAAIAATRRDGQSVTLADFTVAVERIVAGLEKRNRIMNADERRVVAHHEMGHALVAKALPGTEVVHKVSIIPRGIGALGYTIQRPIEDRYLMMRDELENKMAVLLAGRAAETLVFGRVSTGAADDLDKATEIARGMVVRFGMHEALGNVTYEAERAAFLADGALGAWQPRRYSEDTAREIDRAIRQFIDAAFERATMVLAANRAALEAGARRLLEKETLTAEELPDVVAPEADRAARAS